MNKTPPIAFTIIKNRLRIIKNWYFYKDNRIVVIFSAIILFFFTLYFYRNPAGTLQEQTIKILIILLLPILITNIYLKTILNENDFMLRFLNKKMLITTKQIQALISNVIIFSLLLLVVNLFATKGLQAFTMIIGEFFFLIIASLFQPYLIKKKIYISKSIYKNSLWNVSLNKKLLPLRGIVNREILFLWRENKNLLLKYTASIFFINAILILFIVNNNKEDFFIWALFLQFVFSLNYVLNYPAKNNLNLQNNFSCIALSIYKGELIFWSALLLLQLVFVLIVYGIFLTKINIIAALLIFGGTLFLLAYTLLIRLTYGDNIATRILLFFMLFIPITIPFTIFNCYNKLKCKV